MDNEGEILAAYNIKMRFGKALFDISDVSDSQFNGPLKIIRLPSERSIPQTVKSNAHLNGSKLYNMKDFKGNLNLVLNSPRSSRFGKKFSHTNHVGSNRGVVSPYASVVMSQKFSATNKHHKQLVLLNNDNGMPGNTIRSGHYSSKFNKLPLTSNLNMKNVSTSQRASMISSARR